MKNPFTSFFRSLLKRFRPPHAVARVYDPRPRGSESCATPVAEVGVPQPTVMDRQVCGDDTSPLQQGNVVAAVGACPDAGRDRRPPGEYTLSREQFRAMLSEALEDPETARWVARRLLLPTFPNQGAACATFATTIGHGDFGSGCGPADTGDYTFSSSKVGIGTTSPASPLHVNAAAGQYAVTLDSASSSDFCSIQLREGGSSNERALITRQPGSHASFPDALYLSNIVGGSTKAYVSLTQAGDIDLGAGNSRRVRVHNDADKISFGSAADTSLYRSAANTLRTPGSLIADGSVGIGTSDRLSKLTVKGNASFTAAGTVTTSGTTVTGTGTSFTRQVAVGDRITIDGAGAETRYVKSIASDTSLTVDSAFQNSHSNVSMTVLPSILRADDSSSTAPDNVKAVVTDQGSLWLGNRLGFLGASSIVAANELYRNGSLDIMVLRNFTQDAALLKIWSRPGAVVNNREATLALVRGDNDEEVLDVYNNGYTDEKQYGLRPLKLKNSSGVFRDFVFDQGETEPGQPTFKLPAIMVLKPTRKVGIGIRDNLTARLNIRGDFTAKGTVSVLSGAQSTVVGNNTLFLAEINVGDKVQIGTEKRTVTAITDDTHLTVDTAFASTYSGASMTVVNNLLRLDDSSGTAKVFVNELGNVGLGTTTPAATLDVQGDALVAKTGGKVGFYGTTPITKPTITGSRGGNAALANLLTALGQLGLIVDSTTA